MTTTRADYGIFVPLLKAIRADDELRLQIVVSGSHLSARHGLTYQEIEADGFAIDEKVEIALEDDSPVGVANSTAAALVGFSEVLERLKPDIVILLGDRYEILSAATAATLLRIPIAHIHGGESTEGAVDEAFRHAVTKMAHLHFPCAGKYRDRIVQMGEAPERVFNVGSLTLDNLKHVSLASRAELESQLGFRLGSRNFLVTYHPVTLDSEDPLLMVNRLLLALDRFPEAHVIFTKANADVGNRRINEAIEAYVGKNPARATVTDSLGYRLYFSAIALCDVVIGNSSSGLIEVPALQKPTVNIGDRQKGRLAASSVISVPEDTQAIADAVAKALSPEFQAQPEATRSLYGQGNTAHEIKEHLKSVRLDGILQKKFYELPG